MTAREIIAMCQHDHGLTFPSEFEVADHVIGRLTSRGFHILGPDEIDGPTVEKCAEVAAQMLKFADTTSRADQEIAAAIRALKEKRT